jgi:hypothetical protein
MADTEFCTIINTTKSKLPRLPFVSIKNYILGEDYELSVGFLSSKKQKEINNLYRKINKTTNILSFPLSKTEGQITFDLIKVKKDAFDRFELVNGDAIRHWYHEKNYKSINGTLGGSCMRYSKCQGFLTIYVRNPKQVSLLILKPENDNDKIIGRALIWTDDSGRKIMDRIYTIDSSDITLFIQYAKANNYYYKKKQNYEPMPLVLDGVTLTNAESSSIITLEYSSMNYFPYMDTFKYFNEEDGTITNDYSNDYTYELTDTNGGNGSCDVCGGGGRRECSDCDGSGDVSCWECSGEGDVNCRECDGDGEYECNECDGIGDIECDDCDGEGCDDCDNGRKECQNCSNGQIKCDECNSKGVVDCDECDGSGKRECSECYGEGEYDCYECT